MQKSTGISERAMTDIQRLAQKHNIGKVILFGSRARGDYKRTSDIDLAVSGGNIVEFSLDVEDDVWTLLKFDVVNLDRPVQTELKESIQREGVMIYKA